MTNQNKSLLFRTIISLSLLLLVIGGIGAVKYTQVQNAMAVMNSTSQPRAAVEVTTATVVDWLPMLVAVGSLNAREGIDVTAETGGIIEEIHFQSGQRVKKGDLLVSLNDDVEQAELRVLQEQLELAKTVFKRIKGMWEKKAASDNEYDEAAANVRILEANIEATRAIIEKKAIRAPFSGILGIREVDRGQYISPGTALVSLQDASTIYADFSVPERYLPELATGLRVRIHTSAYPDALFEGEVTALEAKVDESTRNIQIRAELPNEDYRLRPGMYADVSLVLGIPSPRVVVPATSIVFSSFGDAVFTVDKNDREELVARHQLVSIGEQRGDYVAISSGLQGGERVVSAGVNKLRNGTPSEIVPDNRLME